ncbi:MAG: hypothetical protein QM541_16425 [Flavobacterium sp.]|nr:hypothetical protein [Flavobacterium sp.]
MQKSKRLIRRNLMPSRIEAWLKKSYKIVSPFCGTLESKPILA